MLSKKKTYELASDDELFELVGKCNPSGPANLLKLDPPLYKETKNRKNLRARFTESRGWRRGVEEWKTYRLADWLALCEQFTSASEFRAGYVAAQNAAYRSKHWPQIQKLLVDSGKWESNRFGMDGRRYDSKAEMIVANWLHYSGVQYLSHPKLQLKESRRPFVGDFQLPGVANVEVFMCSEKGKETRTDLPIWAGGYLERRKQKEGHYKELDLPLLSIEAEIYRQQGLKKYLDHIKRRFKSYGITLCAPDSVPFEYSQHDLGIKWHLEDFMNYAKDKKISMISELQLEATDLYALIHIKELEKEFRIGLDVLHGRIPIAYKKDLRPIEEVRADCLRLGITERAQYEEAHKNGKFPIDTPYSILQSYGMAWYEFINGRKIDDFWNWAEAKKFVQSFKIKTKTEFENYNKKGKGWEYIRKSPAAPSGGYHPYWTNWGDFLGTVSPEEQKRKQAENQITSQLIKEFKLLDTAQAVTYLKKLKFKNAFELSKRGRLYSELKGRTDWIELREKLASRTPKVKTAPEVIEILVREKCLYLPDFLAKRDSNSRLQTIPIKYERLGQGIFEQVRRSVGLPGNHHHALSRT
jgi:hypothetical protein